MTISNAFRISTFLLSSIVGLAQNNRPGPITQQPPSIARPAFVAGAVFTQSVHVELAKMTLTAPVDRAAFVVHPDVAGLQAVTMVDGRDFSGTLECEGANKRMDQLTYEKAPQHMVVGFSCADSTLRDAQQKSIKGTHQVLIGFKHEAVAALFAPSDAFRKRELYRAKLTRTAPSTSVSKDDQELSNCVAAFRKYKTDPTLNYFRLMFSSRVYHCEVDRSKMIFVTSKSVQLRKTAPLIHILNPDVIPQDLSVKNTFVRPDQTGNGVEYLKNLEIEWVSNAPAGWTNDLSKVLEKTELTKEVEFNFKLKVKPNGRFVVQLFDAAPAPGDCSHWEGQPGLMRQTTVFTTALPDGSVSFKKDKKFFTDTMRYSNDPTAAARQTRYLRVVPMASMPLAGARSRSFCVGGPSQSIPVRLWDHGPDLVARDKAEKAEKALLQSVIGGNAASRSPLTVTFMSYQPPYFDTYNTSRELLITHQGGMAGLRDMYDFPQENIPAGCPYDAKGLIDAHKVKHDNGDDFWQSVWDFIVVGWDELSAGWSDIEQGAVNLVLAGLTGGKCDPSDPNSCPEAKMIGDMALKMALAAEGIPPSLPSASELVHQGAEFLAQTATDVVMTQVPLPNLAGFLLQDGADTTTVIAGLVVDATMSEAIQNKLHDVFTQAANSLASQVICSFPHDPTKPIPDGPPGTKGENIDENGCPEYWGEPGSYAFSSGTRNPLFEERPPVVYLKVTPNPQGLIFSFSPTTKQTITVNAGDSFLPASFELDIAKVPTQGLIVPVVLSPDYHTVDSDPNLRPSVGVFDTGLERALWMNRLINVAKVEISASTTYKWTEQAINFNDPVNGSESSTVRASFFQPLVGPVFSPIPNRADSFGFIKAPQTCPDDKGRGFYYSADPVTGQFAGMGWR